MNCTRCNAPMVVDFQLPRCVNKHCGVLRPCQCPSGPEPYDTVVEVWTYVGVQRRPATFCRTCGDEVTL